MSYPFQGGYTAHILSGYPGAEMFSAPQFYLQTEVLHTGADLVQHWLPWW